MKLHTTGEETSLFQSKFLKFFAGFSEKIHMKLIGYISILLILFSCGQELRTGSSKGSSSSNFSGLTCSCSDLRQPVCGFDGSRYITFLNSCIAQCNGFDYTNGTCAPSVGAQCNQSSGEVCGVPACPSESNCQPAGIYSDECALLAAGAAKVDLSQCTQSI